MNPGHLPIALLSLALGLGLPVATAPAQVPEPPSKFESAPTFQASQLLAPELMKGPHHQVREIARSDGFLVHFTIDSDFGVFECSGIREVPRRVREIEAIAALVEVSKSDLFTEGLRRSVEEPIAAVKNIVEHPVDSVKQVPHSVGRLFSQIGSSVGSAVRKVGNPEAEGEDREDAVPRKSIGRKIVGIAGFDRAKLNCARQLGVDPYSDNLRLQEEMEKVTWAFFAGGLPLNLGVKVASAGASIGLRATEFVGLPDDIYDASPAELGLRDRRSLESLGIRTEIIDAVIGNPGLPVSLRHGIVGTLLQLGDGPGRAEFVRLMMVCENATQARFLATALHLMAHRHGSTPYVSYAIFGKLPAAYLADGSLELVAPFDFVSWTAEFSEFLETAPFESDRKRLVLTGTVSPKAAVGLQAAGWETLKFTPTTPPTP